MGLHDLTIRVGGEGGEGIISIGDTLAKCAARNGFNVLTFKTFPAEIKGGYAMYSTRISTERIDSQGDGFHILIVLNNDALQANKSLIKEGTVLVYDGPDHDIEEVGDMPGVTIYNVPMSRIAKKDLKNYRAKNMVALGAICELFNIAPNTLKDLIREKFEKKGEEVVNSNLIGFEAGQEYIKKSVQKTDSYSLSDVQGTQDTIVISGNDAVGLGALAAKVDFFSCYPITPATEVAIWLAKHLPKTNGTLIQAEDEMASLANVIGASYAGKKSMSATSGPGLSLMLELLGLASLSEIPLVLVDVQRGGPSTGLPTKHEQSDLFIAAHGGHGDMPRIVLSPENVEECYTLTIEAFNLSEKYQIPVLLLSDGSLGMRTQTIKRPDLSKVKVIDRELAKEGDENFLRFKHTDSHISPMSAPGMKGLAYVSTGLEHSEKGSPNATPGNRNKMTEKRFKKLADLEDSMDEIEVEGDENADIGIVSWGSTQGTVREALKTLRAEGLRVAAIYPKLVYPVPSKTLEKFAKNVKQVLVAEINYQGQFAELIKSATSINPIKYNIYGGLPMNPCEVVNKVKELI